MYWRREFTILLILTSSELSPSAMGLTNAARSSSNVCSAQRRTPRSSTEEARWRLISSFSYKLFFLTDPPCFQIRNEKNLLSQLGPISHRKSLETKQSKHCGFCIYIFDKSFDQSKSIVRLVRTEKMVLSGLVFARKIARMILIQNI